MEPEPSERPAKMRRMRKPVSCVECRIRKIKCDRNVPNCSACIRRGIRHHCRWGDERDEIYGISASQNPRTDTEVLRRIPRRVIRDSNGLFPLPSLHEEDTTMAALFTNDVDEWEATMENYLLLLPEPGDMDHVFDFYFQELEPLVNCLHHDSFMKEYTKLKSCIPLPLWTTNRQERPDGDTSPHKEQYPSFWASPENYGLFALVFAVLHVACDSMDREDLLRRAWLRHGTSKKDMDGALDSIHCASISLLHDSKCMDHPTLWILQTIILLQRRPYNALRFPLYIVWNSLALRIGQLMGLNRMGSVSDDLRRMNQSERQDDTTEIRLNHYLPWLREFAPNDLVKRELARKVWITLVTTDWIRSAHIDLAYTVSEEMNLTSPPAALTDEELSHISTLPLSVIQDPCRPSPHTYARIQYELAGCVRQSTKALIVKMLRRESLKVDRAQMLEIDAQIGNIVAKLPQFFRFDGVAEHSSDVQRMHALYPYLTMQRLFLQEQIHFRMLVLHSPYLLMAIRDPSQRSSLIACIEGACVVVTVCEELQRSARPSGQWHYVKWHLVVAAVVLDQILGSIQSSGLGFSSIDQSRLRSSLRTAVNLIEDPRTKPMFQPMPRLIPLGHIRRFCASPEPGEQKNPEQGIDALQSSSNSLSSEFSMFGDSLPTAVEGGWGVDNEQFLSNLDFLLTEGMLPMSEVNLDDAEVPHLGF